MALKHASLQETLQNVKEGDVILVIFKEMAQSIIPALSPLLPAYIIGKVEQKSDSTLSLSGITYVAYVSYPEQNGNMKFGIKMEFPSLYIEDSSYVSEKFDIDVTDLLLIDILETNGVVKGKWRRVLDLRLRILSELSGLNIQTSSSELITPDSSQIH